MVGAEEVADVADAGLRDSAGAEQLESGVEQLLAAGGEPLAGGDATVRARASLDGIGGLAGRRDLGSLI